MITCRPGRDIATRSPPSPASRAPVAAAALDSTDISAASGLDTAAVLAVASGAPVEAGLVALGVPAPTAAELLAETSSTP